MDHGYPGSEGVGAETQGPHRGRGNVDGYHRSPTEIEIEAEGIVNEVRFVIALATKRGRGRFAPAGDPLFVMSLIEDAAGKLVKFRSAPRDKAHLFSKFRAEEVATELCKWGYQAIPVRQDVPQNKINGLLNQAYDSIREIRDSEQRKRIANQSPEERIIIQELAAFIRRLKTGRVA